MNHIVIGAGFGDEGKGQTVSNTIRAHKKKGSNIDLVVRFNGGHQAGHTVTFNGVRHVFSNFGAGSLQGVPSYWSRFCTIHPTAIKKEYELLQSKGCTPILYIDPLCPVTTPWDIISNITKEKDLKHGSVGVGFGATIARHEAFYKLFAADLLISSIMLNKVKSIQNYYDFTVFEERLNEWFEAVEWMQNNVNIKIQRPDFGLENVIFEGAQGVLLDQDFGFFPNVTRSKTTAYNAFQLLDELKLNKEQTSVYCVSRVYHTRHGNGPFIPDYFLQSFLKNDVIETNQYNKYQGSFKTAPLNIDWLNYAITMVQEENRNNKASYYPIFTCSNHLLDPLNIPIIENDTLKYISFNELTKRQYGIARNNKY